MEAKEPDKWDRVYVYNEITGFKHQLTQQVGETRSHYALIESLRKTIATLKQTIASDAAKVGEHAARIEQLELTLEKIRKWAKEKFPNDFARKPDTP